MPDATPYFFTDDGSISNNPTLPMLVYSAAVDTSASSDPAATPMCALAAKPAPSSPSQPATSPYSLPAAATRTTAHRPTCWSSVPTRDDPVGGAVGPVVQHWLQR